MPIYEFECLDCGHQFEYLVLRNTPAAECPSCQKHELKQLVSLCAVSSETIRDANYQSARKKASAAYREKQHADHQHLHEHFHDAKGGGHSH